MRQLTILLLICLAGCSTTTTTNTKMNSDVLNGIWIPVKQEMNGNELPKTAFENQKLTISDSTYTLITDTIDKGIIKYKDDNKTDIYSKEGANAGKHFTAIYKFENEQLTVCYNFSGDLYPVTFDTKNKPTYFLSVFKKELAK